MHIKIKKSVSGDTRSADNPVTKEELLVSSQQHRQDVGNVMNLMAVILKDAARVHDWTKITHIDEFHRDFHLIQSGAKEDFKKMYWFQKLHLTERHHLRDRVPENVTLFDVLEQIADCVAAGMARTGKVFDEDIDPEMLVKAYKNTLDLIKANVEVIE